MLRASPRCAKADSCSRLRSAVRTAALRAPPGGRRGPADAHHALQRDRVLQRWFARLLALARSSGAETQRAAALLLAPTITQCGHAALSRHAATAIGVLLQIAARSAAPATTVAAMQAATSALCRVAAFADLRRDATAGGPASLLARCVGNALELVRGADAADARSLVRRNEVCRIVALRSLARLFAAFEHAMRPHCGPVELACRQQMDAPPGPLLRAACLCYAQAVQCMPPLQEERSSAAPARRPRDAASADAAALTDPWTYRCIAAIRLADVLLDEWRAGAWRTMSADPVGPRAAAPAAAAPTRPPEPATAAAVPPLVIGQQSDVADKTDAALGLADALVLLQRRIVAAFTLIETMLRTGSNGTRSTPVPLGRLLVLLCSASALYLRRRGAATAATAAAAGASGMSDTDAECVASAMLPTLYRPVISLLVALIGACDGLLLQHERTVHQLFLSFLRFTQPTADSAAIAQHGFALLLWPRHMLLARHPDTPGAYGAAT